MINLSVDKVTVLAEMFRVLRPGGRIGISDVVAEDQLTPSEREARGSYVGCIAGALSKDEYEQGLTQVGFTEVSRHLHPPGGRRHARGHRQAVKPDLLASSILPLNVH